MKFLVTSTRKGVVPIADAYCWPSDWYHGIGNKGYAGGSASCPHVNLMVAC